ncbi:MAG: AAA family ATPase, partial [Acidimicrobiales bacterium]
DEALQVHQTHPEVVVVTPEGDRFSQAGWRTGSTGDQALDDAQRMADMGARTSAAASGSLAAARSALVSARSQEADLIRELDRNESARAVLASGLDKAESDLEQLATEGRNIRAQREDLYARMAREQGHLVEWQEVLPGLEAESSASAERAALAQAAQRLLRERASEVASMRKDLDVKAAGLTERRLVLARRLEEVERRLVGVDEKEAASRRAWMGIVASASERLGRLVAHGLVRLEDEAAALGERRHRQIETMRQRSERLDAQRRQRSEAERHLSALRERMQRAEIEEAELRLRQEASVEAVRRDLAAEPEEAMESPAPELPDGTAAPERSRELERELRLMGPVNPLALEELSALAERSSLLERQLEDVRSARRDLAKVIHAVDAEIVDVFASAYADVADHFGALCSTLFPGGSGQLRLTDPTNLLETGIEIEAHPPGRNIRRLALLSGGERSLVALAFLFAVFRSRPSPFYMLDEVEAALDDVNLHRFLDLLHDFREEAQLIVVSHQKRTMEAADCLFGVTMQGGGSTKVVSERVGQPA